MYTQFAAVISGCGQPGGGCGFPYCCIPAVQTPVYAYVYVCVRVGVGVAYHSLRFELVQTSSHELPHAL